jgi:uncharacterized membrane protein YdjX (TVP38/TMEM64 family)
MSARWRLATLAAVLLAAVLLLALSGSLSVDRVRGWADGYGAAGPLVFIALSASLTVVFFPGPLLAGASGLLFGTAVGTPVSLVAATLGASLAFCLGRWWAHDAVEEIAGPRTRALRAWVGRKGFLAVLYARIAPGMPYNVVNYAAGLTPVRLATFAAATAIGAAPRAFAYTALGGQLGSFSSWQTIVAASVLAAMAVIGLGLAARDPEIRGALGAAVLRGGSGPGTGSSSRDDRSAGPR